MASILIVDDEEADRIVLGSIFEGDGHDVHFAANGTEALRLYLEQPIQVVITDIVMTGGDGLDLITSLRQINPNAAILAVSGKGARGLQSANELGADRIFTKPVEAAALTQAVDDAVRKAQPRS
jgi:CheY-like chemotaxis protein